MKFHLSREVKTGLIVILLAVSMYWLVYFLKGRDIFNSFTLYHIEYASVEGVSATGPVYVRGLKMGTIKNITYNPQKDLFDVTVQLESKYKIPTNSVAQIYSADLLGSKAIRIQMGNSPQTLTQNSLIQSEITTDIISYLAAELPSLKEQIAGVLSGLDSSVKNLNAILGSQNQTTIENALAQLSETLGYFRSLGTFLNNELPQVHAIINDLNRLSAALSAGSADVQTTLSNLADLTDTLKRANLAETIHNFDLLLNKLQRPDGSLGKLLHSDKLHENISSLLQNLDSLVSQISQNPKKYFKFSVF